MPARFPLRRALSLAMLLAGPAALTACSSAVPASAEAATVGADSSGSAQAGAPALATRIERGKYLVAIGGCHDCHTPGYMVPGARIADSALLAGDAMGFNGPWGTSYPANLRLKLRELKEKEWIAMVRKRNGLPPMPWPSLHHMTDEDLSSLYAYITNLGPAGTHAPAALPPGQTPTTPYIVFAPVFPKSASAR
jgi:mono/diheme cytochrome c family protein